MDSAKYYMILTEQKGKEEIDSKIERKIEEYNKYITRDAAITLLAKESGIYKEEIIFLKIADVEKNKGSKNINTCGKVVEFLNEITYPSGKKSRSIFVEDDSGKIELVFWENNFEQLKKIRINDEINIIGVYERSGRLSLGYRGTITFSKKNKFVDLNSLKDDERVNIFGRVVELKKNNGKIDELFISGLKSDKSKIIIEFGGQDIRFENISDGDKVMLENVLVSSGKLLVGEKSRVFIRKPKRLISGIVKDISFEIETKTLSVEFEDELILKVNGDEIYNFLEVENGNVSLETLVTLKKSFYSGKQIMVKFNDDEKKKIKSIIIL